MTADAMSITGRAGDSTALPSRNGEGRVEAGRPPAAVRVRPNARIALYADVNLNIIDGSAIWLTSLVETLAGFSEVELEVFLKAPQQRDLLTGALKALPRTRLVFPRRVLSVRQALDAIVRQSAATLDALVVRGFALAQEAARRPELRGRLWTYLTDIPQTVDTMTPEAATALERVVAASDYVLCQTEELRGWIERNAPSAAGRAILLPPMVPALRGRRPAGAAAAIRRVVYAGKFAPLWKPLEMIAAFAAARARYGDLELHVFGDKIHNPPEQPGFQAAVEQALTQTPGVVWQRGVSRAELLERLPTMDVAWAWRCPEFERDTRELSTKVLEYGAAGLPVILAPGPVNERALGADYPLFARTAHEAQDLLLAVHDARDAFASAAERAQAASAGFRLDRVRARRLSGPVASLQAGVPATPRKRARTLLVAGHDLKFLRQYADFVGRAPHVKLLEDAWRGHDAHDPERSRRLLNKADVVFCEWCLGNAVWYAAHKRPGQRLVVRFHLQEQYTAFPTRLDLAAVDSMIFVSEHLRREVTERFSWSGPQLAVVPNYVNVEALDRPKLPGAAFNLGLLGICPARKRFDLALDVLESLRQRDPRYKLYVKSVLPWDYAWLWKRSKERTYYEQQFARTRTSPLLADGVIFDPPGADVAAWFEKIGHVLSPSDFESFHLAPAEGAASGARPWIIDRPGAAEIFDPAWVFPDAESIARGILASEGAMLPGGSSELIRTRYHRAVVFEQLTTLTFGLDGQAPA